MLYRHRYNHMHTDFFFCVIQKRTHLFCYRFISPGKCGISHIYLIAGVRIGKSDCQRIPRSQTGPGIFKSQIQRKCSALFYFITQCGKFLPGGRNFPAIFLKQIFVIRFAAFATYGSVVNSISRYACLTVCLSISRYCLTGNILKQICI